MFVCKNTARINGEKLSDTNMWLKCVICLTVMSAVYTTVLVIPACPLCKIVIIKIARIYKPITQVYVPVCS